MDNLLVQTADKKSCLQISSKKVVFLSHKIDSKEQITCLYPVFHIPSLHVRLLLLGAFLSEGLLLRGNKSELTFFAECSKKMVMQLHLHMPGQTLFWLNTQITSAVSLLPMFTVNPLDYDVVHKHFGHPLKNALKQVSGNTKNFPSGITFPKHNPLCKGCAEGKMPSQTFPPIESWAK